MYEQIHFSSVQKHLKPGMIAYDIGAYNGETSLLVAEAVGPENTVIIEPAEVNWPNIEERWNAAYEKSPCATFAGFLDAKDKPHARMEVWLNTFPPESLAQTVAEDKLEFRWLHYRNEDPNVEARPRLTIDTLATITGPPRGFTMDVEGSELLVLQGADKTLRCDRPLVWVSVHPEFMEERFHQTHQQLRTHMYSYGYRETLLTHDHEWHYFFEPEGK